VDLVRHALLFVHLVGFAMLLGGALVQLRQRDHVINHSMLYGALIQVVSGLLLVGVIEGQDDELNHTKIGVKLGVALVVAVLCWVNRRKDVVPPGLFMGIVVLTLVNVGVAVFW
jgi:hypothetical protein